MSAYTVWNASAINTKGELIAHRTYDTMAHAFAFFAGYLASQGVIVDTTKIFFVQEQRVR